VRTPRDRDELAAIERERPEGWEYLLFAGALLVGRDDSEAGYRDRRQATPDGEFLDSDSAMERLDVAFTELIRLTSATAAVLEPDVLEPAFGAPGEPGDARRILQLADSLVAKYRQLIGWSRTLRSVRVPSAFRDLYELAADLADRPIQEVRDFIDRTVETMDQLDAMLAAPDTGPIRIELELTLSVDEDLAERLLVERFRLQGMSPRKAHRRARRARKRFR
jgi:hypothetical protein